MKTVLFLINGLGIEKKESYSVYDANIMPTFDILTKSYMFSKLDSDVKNINDGYRNMSLEIKGLYNYNVYDREALDGNINTNTTVLDINKTLEERKSKLHIFCFVDISEKIVDNLKVFLKLVNKEHDKKIFLHIILTSNNYEDYPAILDVLSEINIDFASDARIGMILGLANLLNSNPSVDLNFLLRNMISELGEKWQSFKQKLDVSYGMKTPPLNVKPFVVNSGFSISNDDMFFIWNYDNVDLTNFINGVRSINYGEKSNNIKFYSLFPIKYTESIPYVLNFEISPISLASNMAKWNFKTIVVAERNSINGINYYLNGMQMVNNPNITYIAMEDVLYNQEMVLSIANNYEQEFIIFNYSIMNCNSVNEMQDILKNIDNVLSALYSNLSKNSFNIVVSSLFGMNRTMLNDKGEICNIVYYKVPIIYVDNFVTKKEYLINDGNISDLFRVCYKSINKNYSGISLVTKKNMLYRMIFK